MITLRLPQMVGSGGMVTVKRWLKQPGEIVAEGEVLLEVETEDALLEVIAGRGGALSRILASAGTTVGGAAQVAEINPAGLGSTVPAQMSREVPPIQPAGLVIPILMPQAGQSMEEGTIVKWHVQPGALIMKGQVLFDIETDKAVVEIEAADEGRLARIVVAEGGTIGVKKPVAYIAESDADVEAYLANTRVSEFTGSKSESGQSDVLTSGLRASRPTASSAELGSDARRRFSPAAKRMMRDRGIDMGSLGLGSGPGGRILSVDLPRNLSQRKPVAAAGGAPSGKRLSKMRKAIAAALQASKQTIPHFYVRMTLDAGPAIAFYKEQKIRFACSINDLITAACARCIAEFPQFRSRVENDEIVEIPSVNIGIAVSLEEGLVVPVLVGAGSMSLMEIASQTRRIVEDARKGRLAGAGEGVFTITNLGMFGVEEFAAIINPPEGAILAVGAARESVLVKDGLIRAGHLMTVTLSCDHRIIDGHLAAKFLARLKELLESPSQLADSPS
jgi:pyruvate dehydrogenase E2 component (dihydrolipoamide acetyltransferase)